MEGIYLIGSRLRSTSLSFFCRQIASFHFPDYEVQKTHKVHTECHITSICDSFVFVKLSFLFASFLKLLFPSKIDKNDSDSLSYSHLSLHLMKLRQIEKWIKGPETFDLFVFLVPAKRKSILHHLPTCCPRKRL